jgi:hypothetical protein
MAVEHADKVDEKCAASGGVGVVLGSLFMLWRPPSVLHIEGATEYVILAATAALPTTSLALVNQLMWLPNAEDQL